MRAGDARADDLARVLVRVDHPWIDADMARMYDVFPFQADIPFYLDLAAAEGGRVLELGCGTGRVLLPLVLAGQHVTGIDASPHTLALAKAKLERHGPEALQRAHLQQADLRSFDVEGPFDLALCAVKTFAYITGRADQLEVLTRVARALRPGGLLVLDLLNPTLEWLARRPGVLHQDLVQELPDGELITRTETPVHTDLIAQVRVIRSIYEHVHADGSVTKRILEWPFRYTFRHEAELLLERAGFVVEVIYGDYERGSLGPHSTTMLAVARKRGRAERSDG